MILDNNENNTPYLPSAIVITQSVFIALWHMVPETIQWILICILAIMTIFAWFRVYIAAVHIGVFFCVFYLMTLLFQSFPQLSFAVAIGVYIILLSFSRRLRPINPWWLRGTFGKEVIFLCVATTVVAGIALLGWYVFTKPDIKDLIDSFLPKAAPWVLIIGGILFSILNAFVEEFAFRGVLTFGLESHFGKYISLVIQAVAFGTYHINGFPRGAFGVVLAAIYGIMIGAVRLRSKGMLAPWIAHVFTDIIIVCIVMFLAV